MCPTSSRFLRLQFCYVVSQWALQSGVSLQNQEPSVNAETTEEATGQGEEGTAADLDLKRRKLLSKAV